MELARILREIMSVFVLADSLVQIVRKTRTIVQKAFVSMGVLVMTKLVAIIANVLWERLVLFVT